jgi:hypothetical protein
MRTILTLLGCIGAGMALMDARLLLRNVVNGTADSTIGLLIPFLFATATLVSQTSARSSTALFGLAALVLAAKMSERGADTLGMLTMAWMIGTTVFSAFVSQKHPGTL